MNYDYESYVGKKIWELNIIKFNNEEKKPTFQCLCSCGRMRNILCLNVVRGSSKRCGLCRFENSYIFEEGCVRGILKNGKEFLFDKEDYEKIRQHKWYENYDGYVFTKINGVKIFLHRFVLNMQPHSGDGIVVDHIDHNKMDNRKSNLRTATISQNKMNNTGYQNTSGFIGVGWHKSLKKYFVRISINKVETHVGYFEDIKDAVKARLMAEKEHYGEFSPQRHLFEEYGV
jgi:hypothetical protein